MEQFKKAQVIMLPTQESTICLINKYDDYKIGREHTQSYLQVGKNWLYKASVTDRSQIPQHLYITSDDEIKEGDWSINLNYKDVKQADCNGLSTLKECKKIISATDSSLTTKSFINYGKESGKEVDILLPQPSQQFIEDFAKSYKGEVITDVLVEYEEGKSYSGNEGLIVKQWLKVNPDNTITIKTLKESWNREEVKNLILKLRSDILNSHYAQIVNMDINNWIKENL